MENKELNILNMTCNHCKITIENALKKIKGIKKFNVNLTNKTVYVEYENEKVLYNIKNAIIENGYEIK